MFRIHSCKIEFFLVLKKVKFGNKNNHKIQKKKITQIYKFLFLKLIIL